MIYLKLIVTDQSNEVCCHDKKKCSMPVRCLATVLRGDTEKHESARENRRVK